MSKFAATTKVPAEQTRTEIERTLARYGASSFGYMADVKRGVIILFQAHARTIRMQLPMPDAGRDERVVAQEVRQRWRALLLVVKAKLEAVESEIATFEDEFLAYTVLPNGQTASEFMQPQIAECAATGRMPAALIGWTP